MRWRCLTKPVMFQPSRASRIIAACGALHNFAIKHGVDFDEELDTDILDADEVRVVEGIMERNPDGVVARNELVRQVFTRYSYMSSIHAYMRCACHAYMCPQMLACMHIYICVCKDGQIIIYILYIGPMYKIEHKLYIG